MNSNKYDVYKKVERLTCSNRENEARVLTTGALKLESCLENIDSKDGRLDLHEALKYNQMIWTIFQSALMAPDCPWPPEARSNMLKLSSFIDQQIFRAMASPSPENLAPIIEINHGLAKGLRANPKRPASIQAAAN
jgi:flagellar protein FlaF